MQATTSTQIIKSNSDKREYRFLRLPNQLQVLLISDPEADKSAASLDVHVGCALDPKPLYGTAHFLEHMLFMGSEKYPSENEYAEYIKNNGGYTNAFTSLMDTNYHFECSNEAFEGGIDRFAQFFLCPLLGDSQTEREMNAVDSEYNMSLQHDGWRKFNLIQNIAHEESVLRRFNCGNLESLKQDGIRESLLGFHKQWYSSNIMNLCLSGKESLDTLQKWAEEKFSGVENKNVTVPKFSEPIMPFNEDNLGQIARFKPIKDEDTLEMYFILPYTEQEFKSRPLGYFSHLFGHEGENSLLSYLKQEDYAMSLSAGGDHELEILSDFSITITLTKKGLANYQKVMAAVFKYAQRLNEQGPQDYVFEETKTVGAMKFEFVEKGDPLQYAVGLTRKMPLFKNDEDMSHLIRCRYIADNFDKERTTELAGMLADPKRCLALVSSKSFEDSTLPKHEKWYKFDYSLEKFDETLLASFNNPEVVDNGKKLDFPPANNLIPKNFDILPKDESLSAKPILLQQWEGIADLWYKKDDHFLKPKAKVGAKIYTKDLFFGKSSRTRVFALLWHSCMNELLREFTYMADCASLDFDMSILNDNINMTWSGFNDSMPNFITETLKRVSDMKNQQFEEVFNQAKEKLSQEWKNFYLQQTFRLAFRTLDSIILENTFDFKTLSSELETFTYQEFKEMQQNWLKSGRMLWYIHGNIHKDTAKSIVDQAIQELNLQSVPKDSLTEVRTIDLSSDKNHFQRLDFIVEDASNENSCLLTYYQLGLHDSEARNKLMNQVVLQYLDEPTFDQLRTKEQLGYVVFSRPRDQRNVLGAWFLVQSPGKDCLHLRNRVQVHLNKMRTKVQNLTEDEFKTQVGAVLTNLKEKDKNMNEEFGRHWSELVTHHYKFDRQDVEIALIQTLTLQEFKDHFDALFFQDNCANRLDVQFNSQSHLAKQASGDANKDEEKKDDDKKEEAKTDEKEEPEPVISHETERKHASIALFKKSMGLFPDVINNNYCSKTIKL